MDIFIAFPKQDLITVLIKTQILPGNNFGLLKGFQKGPLFLSRIIFHFEISK